MICSALLAFPAMAQDTYENARLLGNDLNGTARYVGMGGAMEALGADLSIAPCAQAKHLTLILLSTSAKEPTLTTSLQLPIS